MVSGGPVALSTPTGDSNWKPNLSKAAAIWRSIKLGGLSSAIAYIAWQVSPRLQSNFSLNQTLALGAMAGAGIRQLVDSLVITSLNSEFVRYYRLVIELLVQRRKGLMEEAFFNAYKNHLDYNHFVGEHITLAPPVGSIQTDSSPQAPEVELQRKTSVKRPRVVATQKTFATAKPSDD